MKIGLEVGLLVVGFLLLIKGADWFVEGASGIADRFGIPEIIIGLTVVAFGTSAPEAAVSITAALHGNAGISVGNIVGSNIFNILIILGITSLITTVAVEKSIVKVQVPFMIGITLLLLVLAKVGGSISFIDGIILWAAFLVFLGYLIQQGKRGALIVSQEHKKLKIWNLLLYTLLGMTLVVVGSNLTVNSASELATIVGLSDRFIGLTIVALGTSLPELVTSVLAARRGKADLAIGNIVGSNIFNILFVLGTTALITPVPFAPKFLIDTLVALGAGVLLLVFARRNDKLTRISGVIMLICYGGYFVYLLG